MAVTLTPSPNGTPPNSTLYVRNLEERIKIDELKEALREIFGGYGEILEIVAKKSLERKGQAFIVFDSQEAASQALDDMQGFELFDKPMVIDYAKTPSDAVVKREATEEEFEQHKRRRLAEKERKQAQKQLKRPAPAAAEPGQAPKVAKTGRGPLKSTAGGPAAVPDEYLPPNKVLFVQNLPDDADVDTLTEIFNKFDGFREVRLVPMRKGIAFVEYEAENGAISAKESTAGMPLGAERKPMKVTYQRQ